MKKHIDELKELEKKWREHSEKFNQLFGLGEYDQAIIELECTTDYANKMLQVSERIIRQIGKETGLEEITNRILDPIINIVLPEHKIIN